jgi:hypothetical protein
LATLPQVASTFFHPWTSPFFALVSRTTSPQLSPVDFKTAGQIVDDDILKILVKPMRAGGKYAECDNNGLQAGAEKSHAFRGVYPSSQPVRPF